MPPTEFAFKKSIIKRRIWISGAIVAVATAYFALAGLAFQHWMDALVLIAMGLYSYRLVRDLVRLGRPMSTVIISDEGLRDPGLGSVLIPWAAIKEIRASAPGRLAGQLFLIAESAGFQADPGTFPIRVANWIRGARAGRKGRDLVLAMTPVVALDARLDDILKDIRSRAPTAAIPIHHNGR